MQKNDWANVELLLGGTWEKDVDLSAYDTIAFRVLQRKQHTIQIKVQFRSEGSRDIHCIWFPFKPANQIGGGFVEVPLDDLTRWQGATDQMDWRRVCTIEFVAVSEEPIENHLAIDEIMLHRRE